MNHFAHLSLLLARVALGAYFVIAGWRKLQAEGGIKGFADGIFNKMTPEWLPEHIARLYGQALPILELVLGGFLIVGFLSRLASGALTLMLSSFIVAIVIAKGNIQGLGPDEPGSFHYNYIFILLAFVLMTVGPGGISIDNLIFRKPKKIEPPLRSETPESQDEPLRRVL